MGFVAELGGEFSTLVASKLRVRSERDDLIAALYEEGLPVAVIAERAGVCVKTVRNVARRIGLPARSRLVKALARHGIVPRKTASMRLSEQASRRAAVWLGVLDGDGSVGIYKSGRAPRLYFAGTEALMAQCERFWRTELAIEGPQPTARPHTKGIWTFSLACAKAEAAADALIGASPISMRRKRALLAQIAGRTA